MKKDFLYQRQHKDVKEMLEKQVQLSVDLFFFSYLALTMRFQTLFFNFNFIH